MLSKYCDVPKEEVTIYPSVVGAADLGNDHVSLE
jgi:hypothetical protein